MWRETQNTSTRLQSVVRPICSDGADSMHPGIPEVIQPVLADYTQTMEEKLPGFVVAFYICGSIALNAFNEKFSDIDFIAVVNHQAREDEIKYLRGIHREMREKYPKWKLEGGYLQREDLGHFEGEVAPYPYYYKGILHPRGYHELNSVTWWILKNRGIAVIGIDPKELAFTVDWDLLVSRMLENLNTHWMSWTKKPTRIAYLLTDEGIQWAILGILRQFYTLRENDITSKTGAGLYALSCMPPKWHRLIQEAIDIREDRGKSHYTSKLVRAIQSISFLKYVITSCNTYPT